VIIAHSGLNKIPYTVASFSVDACVPLLALTLRDSRRVRTADRVAPPRKSRSVSADPTKCEAHTRASPDIQDLPQRRGARRENRRNIAL